MRSEPAGRPSRRFVGDQAQERVPEGCAPWSDHVDWCRGVVTAALSTGAAASRPIFERLVDVARVGAPTDEAAAAAHSFIADCTGSLTCTMPDCLIEFPLPSQMPPILHRTWLQHTSVCQRLLS